MRLAAEGGGVMDEPRACYVVTKIDYEGVSVLDAFKTRELAESTIAAAIEYDKTKPGIPDWEIDPSEITDQAWDAYQTAYAEWVRLHPFRRDAFGDSYGVCRLEIREE